MSRSKKVRVYDCIQRVQAAADGARNARGKPPRIQSVSWLLAPTSARAKPAMSSNWTLPARVSEISSTKSQDALPSRSNTALRAGSSQIGRSSSNKWGSRWTSSRTTRPSLCRNNLSGVADSASRAVTSSRSKAVAGPLHSEATSLAKVVLPPCRAPSKATAGASESPCMVDASRTGRGIFCRISIL